ncbi:Uncharacterised protein [uncultured archaeon]|nr:Uncharacterised protein [uncultured archaeon]
MVTAINLSYIPDIEEIKKEEELLEIFSELKDYFLKVSQNFEIKTISGNSIKDVRGFLETAVSESPNVILSGSGVINGLVVGNGIISYDLSKVRQLAGYWDLYNEGTCSSCKSHYLQCINQEDSEHRCKLGLSMDIGWKGNCESYSSRVDGINGNNSRKLAELILEASN